MKICRLLLIGLALLLTACSNNINYIVKEDQEVFEKISKLHNDLIARNNIVPATIPFLNGKVTSIINEKNRIEIEFTTNSKGSNYNTDIKFEAVLSEDFKGISYIEDVRKDSITIKDDIDATLYYGNGLHHLIWTEGDYTYSIKSNSPDVNDEILINIAESTKDLSHKDSQDLLVFSDIYIPSYIPNKNEYLEDLDLTY